MSKISVERMNQIFQEGFATDIGVVAEEIGDGICTVRLKVNQSMVRPGGTLSGPAMMALADTAMWVSLMSKIGEAQLAVTTNLNINFLRKPPMQDAMAQARVLKVGKRLGVIEVSLFTEGKEDEPIAHATGTYSIPPSE